MSIQHSAIGRQAASQQEMPNYGSFGKLQWLFPIAITLHNAEEAIWMPGWDARHASMLPIHPPAAGFFRLVLLILTVIAFGVTYLSARKGPESLWAYLTFGYMVGVLANVFVPHLPATIAFRSYTPGVVTACLINLPLMIFLSMRAVRERWVSGGKAVAFAIGVPLALAGGVVVIFGYLTILH